MADHHLIEATAEEGNADILRWQMIERAARAVSAASDADADWYVAQQPVENWAIDALEAALDGNMERAERIMERYQDAPWNRGEDGGKSPYYRAEYEYDGDSGEGVGDA